MKILGKITIGLGGVFLLWLLPSSTVLAQDIFWSTPAKISKHATNYALQPVMVTDSKGYVHSVWMESTDENAFWNPPSRPTPGILYSFWNGDVWSTPQQVNVPAVGLAELPSLAVTSDDNLHAVWDEDKPGEEYLSQIYYSRWSGTSWSTPVSISAPIHISGANPSWEWAAKIAADSSNNLHVVFSYAYDPFNNPGVKLYYTRYNGTSWSTPVIISQGLDVQHPALTADSSGNLHVLLWDTRTTPDGGIYYTFYNGSTWSGIQKLRSWEASYPRLVIDGSGALHAAWYTYNFQTQLKTVEYSRKPSGGLWSSPSTVSTTLAEPYWWVPLVGLTIDNDNNAYIGWGQYNSTWYNDTYGPGYGSYGVDAMYRKYTVSTDTWSSPIFVRSTKYLDAPLIWRDKWWNQHFVWSEMDPTTRQWQFWYSEVPANTGSYSPSAALTITMAVTTDTIKIPANALASSATISAQIGPIPASADPSVTTIPRSYTFRPHGTTFIGGNVATATIKYTDAEVLGTNESQMKVYIWDATTSSWTTSFTTGVNTGANRISADLPHFSLYGIRGPRAEREMTLTWKPPISTKDLYSMVDGSTLPIKFTLNYADGTPVAAPTTTAEMIVYIRNADYMMDETLLSARFEEFRFGSAENNIRFDTVGKQYLLNLRTKDLDLSAGVYYVKVVYKDITVGAISFQITEPGKVKGAAAP